MFHSFFSCFFGGFFGFFFFAEFLDDFEVGPHSGDTEANAGEVLDVVVPYPGFVVVFVTFGAPVDDDGVPAWFCGTDGGAPFEWLLGK